MKPDDGTYSGPDYEADYGPDDKPEKIEVVICDHSGTTTNDLWPVYITHRGVLYICKELGIYDGPVPTFEEWVSYSPRTIGALGVYIALGIEENSPIADSLYSVIYEEVSKIHRPFLYDGVEDALSSLKDKGMVLGVVSAHPHNSLIRELNELGIDKYFSFVFGDIGYKDEKLIQVSEERGIPPSHMVFIGDTNRDAEDGRRAGVSVVMKRHGYVDNGVVDRTIRKFEKIGYPHIAIDEFPELLSNIEELEKMMHLYSTRLAAELTAFIFKQTNL